MLTCDAALDACQLLVQVCIDGLKHQALTPQVVYLLTQLLVVRDGLQDKQGCTHQGAKTC
jgi:hypothetical protein